MYQRSNGKWAWSPTGHEKDERVFNTKGEVFVDQKKQSYIEDLRQWIRDYQQMMERAGGLTGQWGALYNTIITDKDMPGGVIANSTSQLSAFTSVISNIQTMIADYDKGIDTNFERVK